MDLAIYGLSGIAAIAGVVLVFLWPTHKSAAIWVAFAFIITVELAFFLSWQQKIWKDAEKAVAPAKRQPPIRTLPEFVAFAFRFAYHVLGWELTHLRAGWKATA